MIKRVMDGVIIGGLFFMGTTIIKKLNKIASDIEDIKLHEDIPDYGYQDNQLTAFIRSLYEGIDEEEL